MAEELRTMLTEEELDTHISDLLEQEEARKLISDADNNENPKHYKALGLARSQPIDVSAILKTKKRLQD